MAAARILRIGFAKTIAVVWTDPMAHAFEIRPGVSFFLEWLTHVPSEVSTCFFAGRGRVWRCERLRRNKSDIMSDHLDTHLKDKSDHMQLHVLYTFAFGKSNLPETSVFTTGSAL